LANFSPVHTDYQCLYNTIYHIVIIHSNCCRYRTGWR